MAEAKASAWADLSAESVSALMRSSAEVGWEAALDKYQSEAPFFVKRMKNLGLVNWHVLLGRGRSDRAVDIGTGFGSATLGLGHYYQHAVGLEYLPDRLAFAALRASQSRLGRCDFLRGDGHNLPFADDVVGLAILNGVLEWAAYHHNVDSVVDAQTRMLQEIRRILRADGQVAVAIENRYAAESLAGMDDTHTELKAVTFLPRWMANQWTQLRSGEAYRTWLYSRRGYTQLLERAGFGSVRVFDLVASYNDYDFIVDTEDGATYEFLHDRQLVRGFYPRGDRLRAAVHKVRSRWLAELSYAYLVVGGSEKPTMLDDQHDIWSQASQWGIEPGAARFAMNGSAVGSLVLVTHDGRSPGALVEVSPVEDGETAEGGAHIGVRSLGDEVFAPVGSTVADGVQIRGFARSNDA